MNLTWNMNKKLLCLETIFLMDNVNLVLLHVKVVISHQTIVCNVLTLSTISIKKCQTSQPITTHLLSTMILFQTEPVYLNALLKLLFNKDTILRHLPHLMKHSNLFMT
jgi:hypothetical protein